MYCVSIYYHYSELLESKGLFCLHYECIWAHFNGFFSILYCLLHMPFVFLYLLHFKYSTRGVRRLCKTDTFHYYLSNSAISAISHFVSFFFKTEHTGLFVAKCFWVLLSFFTHAPKMALVYLGSPCLLKFNTSPQVARGDEYCMDEEACRKHTAMFSHLGFASVKMRG